MKRIVTWLLVVLLSVSVVGCGSQAQKGAKKDRDMPKPADKES